MKKAITVIAICVVISLSLDVVTNATQRRRSGKSGSAGPAATAGLTIAQIKAMVKAGIPEDVIIGKIQSSGKKFDPTPEELVELKNAGASDNVIRALTRNKEIKAEPKPIDKTEPKAEQSTPIAKTEPKAEQSTPPREPDAIVSQKASSYYEFKHLIRQRYGGKVLAVMIDGLYAGETGKGFLSGAGDTKLYYIHYHSSVPVPGKKRFNPLGLFGKETSEMDRVDERTFGILKNLQAVPLQRGEPLTVDRIEVLPDRIEFNLISNSFHTLRQIDINKSSTDTDATVGPDNKIRTRTSIPNLGLRFKFFFDKELLKAGEYRTVVAEIDNYLRPQQEAHSLLGNIRVDPGMNEDEVIKRLGQPVRTVTSGGTKMLIYRDMKVILKNGKVVEVKVD